MKWYWISALLFTVGLLKEFRPSEPFVTPFLTDFKNVTRDTVVQSVYPISTYTNLAVLPVIFLLTDFLRYKPVIIAEGIAFVICYIFLLWVDGLPALKFTQVLYGVASSAEVAYYTYMYAKVDKSKYKQVTSYVYAATITGNLLAAVCSQAFVSWDLMNYRDLHYLTLGSTSLALLVSFFLPSVSKSIYFHRQPENNFSSSSELFNAHNDIVKNPKKLPSPTPKKLSFREKWMNAYRMLWTDFKLAYSNNYVLKWSIWWAVATGGYYQITNYVQALWDVIAKESNAKLYNGAVDAVHRLISAGMALLVGHSHIRWHKWGESLLFAMSFIQCGFLIWMSQTNSLMTAYATYVLYRASFQTMITVASAEVAEKISPDSYGLIFGVNRFFAFVIQSIITAIVTDEIGLTLKERPQFVVYGTYHGVLGLIFITFFLVSTFRKKS